MPVSQNPTVVGRRIVHMLVILLGLSILAIPLTRHVTAASRVPFVPGIIDVHVASHDSSMVAYITNRLSLNAPGELFVKLLDGGEARKIATDVNTIYQFTPNDSAVIYQTGDQRGIGAAPVADGVARRLTPPDKIFNGGSFYPGFYVSSDSQYLTYIVQGGLEPSKLYTAPIAGGTPQLLLESQKWIMSDSGEDVIAFGYDAPSATRGLFRISVAGGSAKLLVSSANLDIGYF